MSSRASLAHFLHRQPVAGAQLDTPDCIWLRYSCKARNRRLEALLAAVLLPSGGCTRLSGPTLQLHGLGLLTWRGSAGRHAAALWGMRSAEPGHAAAAQPGDAHLEMLFWRLCRCASSSVRSA